MTTLRDEQGFTIIEVLVAALILVIGLVGALTALDGSQHLTSSSQRSQQALALAQGEVERIAALPWRPGDDQLALDGPPASSPAPADMPPAFVSGSNLLVKQDYADPASAAPSGVPAGGEPLVVDAAGGVSATPKAVTVGGTSGKLYEYVTQASSCTQVDGSAVCPADLPIRRVTVAVVLDSSPGQAGGMRRPVWVSTLVAYRPPSA